MNVLVNGRILPIEEFHVSAVDRGVLLGDGIFETVRLYNRVPFRLGDHLRRLRQGARQIFIRGIPEGRTIRSWSNRLIRQNRIRHGVLRITLTRGNGGRGLLIDPTFVPNLFITCSPYTPELESHYRKGKRLITVPIRRNTASPISSLKTLNMLDSILAREMAKKKRADESLFLNTEGRVSCGASSNIFWIKKRELYTPSTRCGILQGITRKIVLETAKKMGIPTQEGEFSLEEIKDADEVFCTNSLIEIFPVTRLDKSRFGDNTGPITYRLRRAYKKLVREETGRGSAKPW